MAGANECQFNLTFIVSRRIDTFRVDVNVPGRKKGRKKRPGAERGCFQASGCKLNLDFCADNVCVNSNAAA
jgi:hypothetical protein